MHARSEQPFARGQEKPFQTGPFLGGWVAVLASPVAAGGTVAIGHGLRVPPRVAEVLTTQSSTYPSRVSRSTPWSAATATVQFESAQPAGTVIFLW